MNQALKDSVASAIEFIKTCPYKGTAIKVELEAQLDRGDNDDNEVECSDCEGDGYIYCESCNNDSRSSSLRCSTCAGTGREVTGTHSERECETCEGVGFLICEVCDNDGRRECETCSGSGYIENENDWSEGSCEIFILEHVSQKARKALIYGSFYYDGSVDSEFTFTIGIDNAWLIPEYIQAFKALGDAIGNGIDTSGAGMHISVLNSPKGRYPEGNTLSSNKFSNFAQAMTPLLFALYFLSSCDHKSRGLGYRHPVISDHSKYSAVYGYHGIEYRCFETCYQRPEAFFDYLCTIAKSLQFYTSDLHMPEFYGKIGKLGIKDGRGVSRFYFTVKHLAALREGLKILKPDHKSIETLYRERNFKATPQKLREAERKALAQWIQEWDEFKERQKEQGERRKREIVAEWNYLIKNYGRERVERENGSFKEYLAKYLERDRRANPTNRRDYIRQKQEERATYQVNAVIAV